MLARYRGRTVCPDCQGTRLRTDASFVRIGGKSIIDIVLMTIEQAKDFFSQLKLSDFDTKVSERIVVEITNRLQFLHEVGLQYLNLNRLSNTLSGGESQRINLATSLGSSLVGSMYILDEPSIGLHPKDTQRLIKVLLSLRDLGNTVIVVEHDEEIMHAADHIIDMGPLAGTQGGEVVFSGNWNLLRKNKQSMTARYLNGLESIAVPLHRRKWKNYISISGARENNLKNLDVKFPLQTLTAITGVSGSGKSTLIRKLLYPALLRSLGQHSEEPGLMDAIRGDLKDIGAVELIDQNPIGKSSRSNPVTYVKAYDEIRSLFAELPLARSRGLKPSHFSFNVEGGRCEICQGEGTVTIAMQFMADIHLTCEACNGKRFRSDILEIAFKGKSISDVLDLTVSDAMAFFEQNAEDTPDAKKIIAKIKPLWDVGLDYVTLGQPASTLSGGEAQRIKLASFLTKGQSKEKTVFIFDEPTTGLHFHDIKKLLDAFQALLAKGHSLFVIEHNMDVVKCADWVIDMGPEGGENGGNIVFEGIPEDLAKCKASRTGKFLGEKLHVAKK
jgi:excinuclease ABC subunit A